MRLVLHVHQESEVQAELAQQADKHIAAKHARVGPRLAARDRKGIEGSRRKNEKVGEALGKEADRMEQGRGYTW